MEIGKVIDRYKDFHVIGHWGEAIVRPDGTIASSKVLGKMLSETVKVQNEDGTVSLQKEWIPDSEIK